MNRFGLEQQDDVDGLIARLATTPDEEDWLRSHMDLGLEWDATEVADRVYEMAASG
jgi:hypothetical protein